MRTSATTHLARILASALIIALPVTMAAAQGQRSEPRPVAFDVIIRGGEVYDGTGRPPVHGDVGIRSDRIAAIGDLKGATAATTIDATGLAVAPGFINMLSHSKVSLIVDGRSMGELKQGVTTQIFGEFSMGPLNEEMKRRIISNQGDVKFDIKWTTLSEYLIWLEKNGISPNVASFIGAPTIREQSAHRGDSGNHSNQPRSRSSSGGAQPRGAVVGEQRAVGDQFLAVGRDGILGQAGA